MPSDESNSRHVGRGVWPRRPGGGKSADLQLATEIQRQVTELAQRRYEPAVRHELLRKLAERRAADAGGSVIEFDRLLVDVGYDSLLVPGELLISQQSFTEAEPYLTALGFARTELDHRQLRTEEQATAYLADRMVVLKPQDRGEMPRPMSGRELADVARNLRLRGYAAAVTPVAMSAPVVKGQGGPRPAASQQMPQLSPSGPKVAIIDTGISPQRSGTVQPGSMLDDLHQFPLGNTPQDIAERNAYLSLDAGHGTFVTGIVQQIAPGAEITVYRALDSDGIGSDVTIAAWMIRAVLDGNEIINLSLGCQTENDFPPVAMGAAVDWIGDWERETGREVLIVAAAGNYGDTRPCWPAAFHRVVSVAGLAPDMLPAQWSSRGFWVTCSTIGQGLASTFVEGTESPLITLSPVPPGLQHGAVTFTGNPPWAVWSGTSFTAPQITGAVANRYPGSRQTLRGTLQAVLAYGWALPDFGQAVQILDGI
jgi:subtilisin family serine protease